MSGSETDRLIATIEAEIAVGAPHEALDRLAAARANLAADPRLYHKGFEALSSAAAVGAVGNPTAERAALYRQLLLQEGCAERPLVLHHRVASLLTSDNAATAEAVTAAVTPVLHGMLEEGPPARALVLFLLVARSCLGDWPAQADITGWHLDAFHGFSYTDMALPYNVMFNPDRFGRNRSDLLERYGTAPAIRASEPALGLRHFLLLEWLGAPSLFTDTKNRDLLDMLERCLPEPQDRESEEAAARSLILRHWRQGSVLTPERTETLGLGAAVLEAAAERAFRLHPVGDPPDAARIGRRTYQAAQVARRLVARCAPFIARPERSIRVAVCVSGQLRGYRAALASWRKTLLNNVSHDIFVHTWERIGRADAQPFRTSLPFEGEHFCAAWRQHGTLIGYESMQTRYPSLFTALESGDSATETELREAYDTSAVVVEDETAPRFDGFSNQQKMHYKIWMAHQLAAQTGDHYDLILRIRPDFGVRIQAFLWRNIATVCRGRPIIWSERPFGVHYGNPMIGDQVAVGGPETMEIYADAWKTYLPLARLGLAGAPTSFKGHVSLAQTTWLNRISTSHLPIKGLGLLEPAHLPAAEIRKALRFDSIHRQDLIDQVLLKAIDHDLA